MLHLGQLAHHGLDLFVQAVLVLLLQLFIELVLQLALLDLATGLFELADHASALVVVFLVTLFHLTDNQTLVLLLPHLRLLLFQIPALVHVLLFASDVATLLFYHSSLLSALLHLDRQFEHLSLQDLV